MLSREQRQAVRKGSRAQREEEAPAPRASVEAMAIEHDEEGREQHRKEDRQLVIELIKELNRTFGVGGGNKDTRRRTALNPA